MAVLVFVLVAVGLIGLLHWYLWRRLVRDTTLPGRARRAGAVAAVALVALVVATLVASRALPPNAARWIAWPGYIWLALFFYLLVGTALLELPRLVVLRRLRRSPAPVPAHATATGGVAVATDTGATVAADPGVRGTSVATDDGATTGTGGTAGRADGGSTDPAERDSAALVSRRLLLARSGAAVVGVAAAGVVGYGMSSALGGPRITPVTVSLARLPAGLDGLRIAVVSDIHLGPLLGRAHTERIVRVINEQQVDLVTIVGDLVDGTVDELGEAAAPLRDLTSVHGSFFVTGNHEYYSGAASWVDELARLGVNPLVNERVEIRAGGGVLDLAGVNDVNADEGNEPDLARALDGRDTSRPVVLLAHQPIQVEESADHGVDLQLSGHTHGGQLFPFHGIVRLEQPAVSGLHRIRDTQLFVTRGAGFWGPPVRVGAPPEVAIVRLTPG